MVDLWEIPDGSVLQPAETDRHIKRQAAGLGLVAYGGAGGYGQEATPLVWNNTIYRITT